MRKKFNLLLLVLLGLPNYAVATRDICGAPPPDQFIGENNESIKGDLTGKANFLSGFVGKADLGGKIEATRKDIFAKYPDANAAYMDRYLAYMFCYVLFDPKNKQSTENKIKAIQEFRLRQQSPQSLRSFDGIWFSDQHRYGFRIEGKLGIATVSNSPKFSPGDQILRFEPVSDVSFHGEHLFTDGRWYQVSGQLIDQRTLKMQGGGYVWIMSGR